MKNGMKKMLMIGVMVLSAMVMLAQEEYHIKNFGKGDDLKVRGTTCIAQVNGFMWIGTSTGLVAFDGEHSYVYSIPDKEGLGGFYSRVSTITPENGERFWVGTKRGIYIFELSKERLVEFQVEGVPKYPMVSAMQFDGDGNMWTIMNGRPYMVDVKKKKAELIGDGLVAPFCMKVTRDGTVWMGDNSGVLYRYDSPNRRLRSYVVKPEGVEKFTNLICITEMDNGMLALTTASDGVCLFSPEEFTSKLLMARDDEGEPIMAHTAITPDGENLWVGSERGILIYRMKDGHVSAIRESHTAINSLSDNAVHSLYKDEEGGVWAGTFFGGMNRISLSPHNFSVFMPKGERDDVDAVREICGDNHGNLWVGVEDGGLYLFDREKKELRLANVSWGETPPPFNVQGLMMVGDDLWVSTIMRGIYVVDTQSMRLKKWYSKTNRTSTGHNIGGISLCRQNGTIFVASSASGVYIFDEEKEEFNLMPDLTGMYAHHLYADRHGNVWLATFDKGLWKIYQENGKWKAEQTPFSYKCVTVITEDSKGLYWVGTDIRGLMSYDDKTKKTHSLNISERLMHQSINSIVEDHHHRLWLGTFDGLYSYNIDKKVVNRSTISNGLPTEYMNYSASFVDKDGIVYVGTYKGMVRFNPASFFLSRERLKPFFLHLYVNGQYVSPGDSTGILTQTLFLTKELALPHAQNTIRLDYAVPSYKNGSIVWYRYRLKPDDPWVVTDKAQPIQLTNLSTGEYSITLQASYNPDVWEGEPAVLYVTIAPPGWLSMGAILGYVLLIVFIVVIVMSAIKHETHPKNKE